MDPRIDLLKAFYRGLPRDRAKVETEEHGFPFLGRLLTDGTVLEYGELTLSGLLHKYKLAQIPERRMDGHLAAHVAQTCNVCLYFHERENDLFCLNLDNNHRATSGGPSPEMEFAIRHLAAVLREAGCEPLVVASGRGYHAWGRLEAPVPNAQLYDLMLRAGVATAGALHRAGHDHHRVKFNFYPDPRTHHVVSLRLFGSRHARTREFSRVLAAGALLDEAASWEYFADYVRNRTISVARFDAARASLAALP
jgi:hypothetical protein